jgi:hypothetical protein
MAFDDLAKHMASRDGRKKPTGDVDQILADAATADRRMTRTRNLILGALLMAGGALVAVLCFLYMFDAVDPKPNPLRPPENSQTVILPYGLLAASIGAFGTGAWQLFRGLRGT